MSKTMNIIRWILIVVFGLAVVVNFLGLIVESVFLFLTIDLGGIQIRAPSILSVIFSLVYIGSGSLLVWYLIKKNKKSSVALHVFFGIWVINAIYSSINPTYIVTLVPYFIYISLALLVILWALVFFLLRKMNFSNRRRHKDLYYSGDY